MIVATYRWVLVQPPSVQDADEVSSQTTASAASTRTTSGRTRPVPTRGSRSVMLPRSGSPRPRTTSTRMMTRNGTASAMPWRCGAASRSLLQCVASDCATPMKTPPSSAAG